jgi:2'-5' RNA ligase
VSAVYSIWLLPDADADATHQLEGLISDYAQSYDDAPVFDPHITVLGGLTEDQDTVMEGTRTLIQDRAPFEVSFPRVHCSTTRYQCVFLLVEPTREILSLHRDAVEIFEVAAGMYVPHLSLVYSDMSIEKRAALARSVDSASVPDTAPIGSVAVVETTGSIPEWETVAEYQLSV